MQLKHYQQFKQILDKYQVSDHTKHAIKDLKLVLLLAATSSGRNTVIRHLVGTGRYYFIVSDTTRPPRINDGKKEENGQEYWFRTEAEMLADLRAGVFLEAEIIHNQQVSGINLRELEKAKAMEKIAITDINIQGMHNILLAKPDTIAIMLLPPSYDEWQRRLAGRGQMHPDELKRRLETAQKVFKDGLENDYYRFIIAEDIRQSAALIDAIVEGKTNPHQDRGHDVLQHLQSSLADKLSNAHAL